MFLFVKQNLTLLTGARHFGSALHLEKALGARKMVANRQQPGQKIVATGENGHLGFRHAAQVARKAPVALPPFQSRQRARESEFRDVWGDHHPKTHIVAPANGKEPEAEGAAGEPAKVDERTASQHTVDFTICFKMLAPVIPLVGIAIL